MKPQIKVNECTFRGCEAESTYTIELASRFVTRCSEHKDSQWFMSSFVGEPIPIKEN